MQQCQTSRDQSTTKLLIRLQDGQQVESVIMHYDTTGTPLLLVFPAPATSYGISWHFMAGG